MTETAEAHNNTRSGLDDKGIRVFRDNGGSGIVLVVGKGSTLTW